MLARSLAGAPPPELEDGMNRHMKVRTTARIAAALVGAACLSVMAAPFAGAQAAPYGSTTTTAPGEVAASCSLTRSQAKPGETVTGRVDGVFFGENVRILFDSSIVAEKRAPGPPLVVDGVQTQSAGTATVFNGQALAAAPGDPGTTSVVLTFQVPKSAAVGTHIVRAVGDTFTCFCNPDGKFTVLAASSGSSLARTGVEAGLLVAVAVALLLFGRGLLMASRRGRGADPTPDELDEDRSLASSGR
jgi:hypothetical protein